MAEKKTTYVHKALGSTADTTKKKKKNQKIYINSCYSTDYLLGKVLSFQDWPYNPQVLLLASCVTLFS
jgi:hypothetical protein